MGCTPIYRALRSAEGLLPDGIAARARRRWLDPHRQGCEECDRFLARRDRLDSLLGEALRTEAAVYASPAGTQPFPSALGALSAPSSPLRLRGAPSLAFGCAAILTAALVWIAAPQRPDRDAGAGQTAVSSVFPSAAAPTGPATALLKPEAFPQLAGRPREAVPASEPPRASSGTGQVAGSAPPPEPDGSYLSGEDPELFARWTGSASATARQIFEGRLPAPREDFVLIPLPRLADAGPGSKAAADALKKYERDAKAIDARLSRKVTLQLKAASLEDLCSELERETQIRFHASRGVADEKATVLVRDLAARDVLRAVARLFGYLWTRTGEEGSYKYELGQSLKAQLAEEELRNADLHAALLALDDEMGTFGPYLGKSPEELRADQERAQGAARDRLGVAADIGWGGVNLYHRLAPAERVALAAGQELRFSEKAEQADRRLPPEWHESLLSGWQVTGLGDNISIGRSGGGFPTPNGQHTAARDWPGAYSQVWLKIDRSELGQLSLKANTGLWAPYRGNDGGVSMDVTLAVGKSPSSVKPDNATPNAALKNDSLFRRTVTFEPKPSCPWFSEAGDVRAPKEPLPTSYPDGEWKTPHVTTADVWEEVHRVTGMPIVADSYTHLYPQSSTVAREMPLFDALCREGETLRLRWKKDGGVLLCRSAAYFWEKLKEVPNPQLQRWQLDREREGGLPLADLLEMATLSDAQLDSDVTAEAIRHCLGLEEWAIVGGGPRMNYQKERGDARLLTAFNPAQLKQAMSPKGIGFEELLPPQQAQAAQLLSMHGFRVQDLVGSRLRVQYAPRGTYVWHGTVPNHLAEEASRWPVILGRTPKETLAAAQRLYPAATENQVMRSGGILSVAFQFSKGFVIDHGRSPLYISAE